MPKGDKDAPFRRRKVLQTAGALGAAGLAGCSTNTDATDSPTTGGGGGEDTDTPEDTPTPTEPPEKVVGGDMVYASTSTPSSINPYRVDDTTTGARVNKMLDYPGGADGTETYDPGWIKSWELSDDSTVVEYELYDGLEFGGDYGQLTAEDVIYSLNELMLLTGDDDWYAYTDTDFYMIGPDSEMIQFEKTGDLTFRAELPVSKANWLHEDPLLGTWFLPKEFVKPYREDEDAEGMDKDSYITEGTYSEGNLGPYEFDTWTRNSRMAFTRNDDYYRRDKIGEVNGVDYSKSPYWDTLTYQQFDESSTALSALKTGEVDLAGIPDQKVSNFRGNESTQLYESPFDNGVFWLNLNHRINGWDPIRESREVRYAIGNAFDPDTVIEEAYNGLAVPLRTFHPSWGPYYPPEDKLTSLPGDLEKAREQLESGTGSDYGYEGDKFVGPDGQVELNIVRTVGNPSVEISTNYLKQRLEQLGIKSTIEAKQWSTLLQNYAMNSPDNVEGVDEPDWSIGAFNGGPWDQSASAEDWDLMVGLGFSTSPYAPWSAVKSTLDEQGTFNLWGYQTDEYDIAAFIGEASTASTQEEVQTKMTEIFSFISEDMPFIFTSSGYNVTGLANDIVGIPGKKTDDGRKSTSYWQDVNEAQPERLYARNKE